MGDPQDPAAGVVDELVANNHAFADSRDVEHLDVRPRRKLAVVIDADVRQSVLRVRRSPLISYRDLVRGFVYGVDTHRLREVDLPED